MGYKSIGCSIVQTLIPIRFRWPHLHVLGVVFHSPPFSAVALLVVLVGQGAIVRRGMEKVAAYRDDKGALHLNSASCSHVGCHLHWNSFETCWDCPCHGSMFDIHGLFAVSTLETN